MRQSEGRKEVEGGFSRCQHEILKAHFQVAFAQHRTEMPGHSHAVDPMAGIEHVRRAPIALLGQFAAVPGIDLRRIEIDLSPEGLLRGHMVGEGDVATVAQKVDKGGGRKDVLQNR
jgi:hypothetical protein